eukprot:scaffold10302_cov118-Cylindrotheca_fusiformis.AAC.3
MSFTKKVERPSKRKQRSKSRKTLRRIEIAPDGAVSDDTVIILATVLPPPPPTGDTTRRKCSLWIYCVVVSSTVLLLVGILVGALVAVGSKGNATDVSQPIDFPTNMPTAVTSNPTVDSDNLNDNEKIERCRNMTVRDGNFEWRENAYFRSFDISMDVMLKFESDLPLLMSGLRDKMQETLLPVLFGCDDGGRSILQGGYTIVDGTVEARLLANDTCRPQAENKPCYRAIATIILELEKSSAALGLYADVTTLFGNDSMVNDLGLMPPFQEIDVVEVIPVLNPAFAARPFQPSDKSTTMQPASPRLGHHVAHLRSGESYCCSDCGASRSQRQDCIPMTKKEYVSRSTYFVTNLKVQQCLDHSRRVVGCRYRTVKWRIFQTVEAFRSSSLLRKQHNGLFLNIWRADGFPYHGKILDVKYHQLSDDG